MNQPPWMNNKIRLLLNERDHAYKLVIKAKYHAVNQKVHDAIKEAKMNYVHSQTTSKAFWSSINYACGYKSIPDKPKISDANLINQEFAKNFSTRQIPINFDYDSLSNTQLTISRAAIKREITSLNKSAHCFMTLVTTSTKIKTRSKRHGVKSQRRQTVQVL